MYFNRNPLYLEAARLAALGYRVFPCVPDAKRPLTAHGLKDATTNVHQLRGWWGDYPKANVAIVTDGLLVVDCDVDKITGEPNAWLADAPDLRATLQHAPTARTPRGGLHLVFRQPAGIEFRNTASKLAPGIDTRATGGYILVSPSQVDGKTYEWQAPRRLDCRAEELPEPPAWLINLLNGSLHDERSNPPRPSNLGRGDRGDGPERRLAYQTHSTGTTGSASASAVQLRTHEDTGTASGTQIGDDSLNTDPTTSSPSPCLPLSHSPLLPLSPPPQPLTSSRPDRIPEGTRHATLVRYAGQMRRFGATPTEILAALRDRNANLCQPPLPDVEVEAIATGVARYAEHPVATAYVNGPLLERGHIVELAGVQREDVKWLWPNRIPLGKITLICGDPGMGKSFLALDIAARASRGDGWPDNLEFSAPPSRVILLNCEDALGDTIVPRLHAAGACIENISALEGVITPFHDGTSIDRSFDLSRDLPILRRELEAKGNVRLVVIDPISGYCGQIDSHKNTDVRALLAPLTNLAAEFDVAIILITHLSKNNTPGRAVYRAMGSLAFAAASRSVWVVDKDPHDPNLRLWVPVKFNCGEMPLALGYRLIEGHLEWDDTPVVHTADQLLAGVTNPKEKELRTHLTDEWLRNFLADGPRDSSEVIVAAEAVGITLKQINRAKTAIGVLSTKGRGQHAKWTWSLPAANLDLFDASPIQTPF